MHELMFYIFFKNFVAKLFRRLRDRKSHTLIQLLRECFIQNVSGFLKTNFFVQGQAEGQERKAKVERSLGGVRSDE